jgi:hypothetical protein
MNILDRLLEQYLIADVTETAWWTDGVFRALEQELACSRDAGEAVALATAELPTE